MGRREAPWRIIGVMSRAVLALVILGACGGGDDAVDPVDGGANDGGANDGGGLDAARGDPLVGIGTVTPVMTGYMFTEGPQWRAGAGEFVFSDIPANRIYRWTPGGAAPASFRQPSGNANGLAVDPQGQLIACEHGTRRISRGNGPDPTTVVERFETRRFNSPNDAVVRSDGTIYFTDPPYGLEGAPAELDFMGVFRVAPGGAVTAERRGALTERPNGLALAPDQRTLYVGDSEAALVRAFTVAAGGALSEARTFVTPASTPDGMAVDVDGNLFVATSQGVEVYRADGHRWGVIAIPQQPSNCAFGGVDGRTLLVTARTGVYQVTVANPGLPTH